MEPIEGPPRVRSRGTQTLLSNEEGVLPACYLVVDVTTVSGRQHWYDQPSVPNLANNAVAALPRRCTSTPDFRIEDLHPPSKQERTGRKPLNCAAFLPVG